MKKDLIETHTPLEPEHEDHKIKIIGEPKSSKLSRLVSRHQVVNEDPETIIHHDGLKEWYGGLI